LLNISSNPQRRSAGQLKPPNLQRNHEKKRVDLDSKDVKDGQEGKA
jgi:hypothetical protein